MIQQEDIRTCKNTPGSCYDGAAQTAAGLSQDRRWLFLVVDVRKGKLLDLAQWMRDRLAAWDAIKFDGGGSSQLWYGGQTLEAGDGRKLSQLLAVIAEPGAGIQDTVAVAGLSAQPTSPLFFDIILPSETAHLKIEVRNTGATTWQPGQSIALRRVRQDVVSPMVESYPLPHAVAPGETASWEIALNVGGDRFIPLRFQMHQGDRPFGPQIGALVIILPEQLKTQEETIRQLIERQLRAWQQKPGRRWSANWRNCKNACWNFRRVCTLTRPSRAPTGGIAKTPAGTDPAGGGAPGEKLDGPILWRQRPVADRRCSAVVDATKEEMTWKRKKPSPCESLAA
jgi:hypothetical protein